MVTINGNPYYTCKYYFGMNIRIKFINLIVVVIYVYAFGGITMSSSKKYLVPILVGLSAIAITGCVSKEEHDLTSKQKLDLEISKGFKLVQDTAHDYRVCVDEKYLKKIQLVGDNVKIPSFRDRWVRQTYDSDRNEWFNQVPIGTYKINGIEFIVEGCNNYHYFSSGGQTGYINGNSTSMNIKWNIIDEYGMGITGIDIIQVSFDGKDYFKKNVEDSAIVAPVNRMANRFLPIVDSIDKGTLKQYNTFRVDYLAKRNDAIVNSMKKSRLLR